MFLRGNISINHLWLFHFLLHIIYDFPNHLCRYAAHRTIIRHILCHHCTCGNDYVIADFHPGKDCRRQSIHRFQW